MADDHGRLRQLPHRGDRRLFLLPTLGFAILVVAAVMHLLRLTSTGFSLIEATAGVATLVACAAVGLVGWFVGRSRRDTARLAALQNAMPFAFTEQFHAGPELIQSLRLLRDRGIVGGSLRRTGSVALAADTESIRLYTGWREPRLRMVLRSSTVVGVAAGSRDTPTGPLPQIELTVGTADGVLALPLTLGRTNLTAPLPVLAERVEALATDLRSAITASDLADH